MTKHTYIYWNKPSISSRSHQTGEKFFSSRDQAKGCCEFLRYTSDVVTDFAVVIETKNLPTEALIKTVTGFNNKIDYIKWWIELINSLGTYKVDIIAESKTQVTVYIEAKSFKHIKAEAIPSRLLSSLSIIRYIWSKNTQVIPLITKYLLDNKDIDPIYAIWIANMIALERGSNDYGGLFVNGSIATRSVSQHKAYFIDGNNKYVTTSAGISKQYSENIRKILSPMYDNAKNYFKNTDLALFNKAIDNIIDFIDNKLALIGKKLTIKLTCLGNLTKKKDYVIRAINFSNSYSKPSIEIMDNDFKLIKIPISFCNIQEK